MACCALALAFVYQLIDAWCRVRRQVDGALDTAGRLHARFAVLRARKVLWLALAIEFAAAGALAQAHEHHLRAEAARLVFATTSFAADICRALPSLGAAPAVSHEE